jgi:DNA helicase-2/ATP-dependent DNA helicase PcrA
MGDNMLDLSRLNKNQLNAVTNPSKYIRVVAGAGSGKTRVLTNRICYLIESGISIKNILAITFTNKASNEMKTRVINEMGVGYAPLIATFHSFCVRFLKEEINLIGYPRDFNILDEEDKTKAVKEILKDNDIDKNYLDHKEMINFISYIKTNYYNQEFKVNMNMYGYDKEQDKKKLYEIYQEKLKKLRSLDFDDLLVKTYEILVSFPEVKEKWQKRYKFVLVDEFQDTNDIQFDLIKLIVGKENSLFVVGDPDQTIYTWRGANLKIIMDFERYYPGATTIILDENYRSKSKILRLANTLIKNNKKRVSKDLITNNGEGEDITYYNLDDGFSEANKVVNLIIKDRERYDYDYKDIAILYRSNYLSRDIENALVRNAIPYKVYGGVKFYERKEIKDSLSYLRILVNKNDDISLERIINEPKRGLGDTSLEKFKAIANTYNISLYEAIKENIDVIKRVEVRNNIIDFYDMIEKFSNKDLTSDLVNLLDDLLSESGYYKMLIDQDEEERKDNIKELMNNITYYENNASDPSLSGFLQEITLFTSQDEMDDGNHVSLMTIHTAKGLEYKDVFVIGLCEGVFPSEKSLMEDSDNIEEERRLAYVAFTRAMEVLHLSSNHGINFVVHASNTPSRFIKEVEGYYKDCNIVMSVLNERKPSYGGYSNNYYNQNRSQQTRTSSVPSGSAINKKVTNDIVWGVGDKVNHAVYGFGVVLSVKGQLIDIAFKDSKVGVKTMMGNHASLSKE